MYEPKIKERIERARELLDHFDANSLVDHFSPAGPYAAYILLEELDAIAEAISDARRMAMMELLDSLAERADETQRG